MPTGACGINCGVCKLRLLEICSCCGSGKSVAARKKLEAQQRLFGGTCAVLSCACMNNLEYCMRDCSSFPCENFRQGDYPFSNGFLDMQKRRLQQKSPPLNHNRILVTVPPEYWDKLQEKDVNTLCNFILAEPHPSGGLMFRSLRDDVWIDMKNRCMKCLNKEKQWEEMDDPLIELVALLYLHNVNAFHPLTKDIVDARELREGHFFRGSHKLKMAPLLERYGNDLDGFREAAEYLGGKPVDMANAAYMLLPFPRIPLYYLLWQGDKEFKPRGSILFDRSIEHYLAADAIWGLVNRVSLALLRGPDKESL